MLWVPPQAWLPDWTRVLAPLIRVVVQAGKPEGGSNPSANGSGAARAAAESRPAATAAAADQLRKLVAIIGPRLGSAGRGPFSFATRARPTSAAPAAPPPR